MTSHCCQKEKPVSHSHQLLNHIVDCLADRKPQALYAEYPVAATSYGEGFMKITYGRLANAINRIAWWLADNLGPGRDFETLAYIGPNDLVYPALILGAIKAGYKTLLLSPRNSIDAQQHLLQVTNCKVFLIPEPCPPPVSAILESLDDSYRVLKVLSVKELLQLHCKPFDYDVTFAEGRHTPLLVMHTSGSTGLPKPITWPQDFVAAYAKQLQLDPPAGYESTDKLYEGNRIFVVFPPFHAAYIAHALINAITNQTAAILPLSGAIPSARSLLDVVRGTKVDAAFVVPTIIEEMSRSPDLLNDIASRVDTVIYSGGDVPQDCGDIVAARIPVVNFYGSTEGASLALIHPKGELSREEWKFLSLHPDAGADFRHHAEDMYELYIVRRPELEAHQQIFRTFPDLHEFCTHDLFRRHPQKPDLWSHCGRADDTIVLLTGEKVNPVSMEQSIFSQNPEISGVLVTGSQYFQVALLIELVRNDEITDTEKKNIIERLWPSIECVNRSCPSHARIAKTHVIITDLDRPMSRSPKGTIQRTATITKYANDLEALYKAADQEEDAGSTTAIYDLQDTESALQCLQELIITSTGKVLTAKDDFFVQGLDSLQALLLVREIRRLFSIPHLQVGTLYTHPTLLSLVKALQEIKNVSTLPQLSDTDTDLNSISSILTRYSGLIDSIPERVVSHPDRHPEDIYLLTGSTGFLGSYILETLTKSKAAHIYCLNRSANSEILQRRRNVSQGLSTNLADSQVTFLKADLSDRSLGLETTLYNDLLGSVTHIIHNAWSVDFNIPLSSYHPQFMGIVNLIRFAAKASKTSLFLYVSSVSAVSHLQSDTIPETFVNDKPAAVRMGYGASKYIAEGLLHYASQKVLLDIQIARVGQIAGPILGSGEWNKSEWLPSMIRSSLEICAIPQSLGMDLDRVDWIPVDLLASILLELLYHTQAKDKLPKGNVLEERFTVFNILNPQLVLWQELLPTIVGSLSSLAIGRGRANVQEIALHEWIKRVQSDFEAKVQAAETDGEELEAILEANPAIKLLGFYEVAYEQKAHSWDTEKARNASATFRSLGKVRAEWMKKWMTSWLTSK